MNINIFYYDQGALFDLIKLWKYLNSETDMLVIHVIYYFLPVVRNVL